MFSCSKNSAEKTATEFVDLYYVRIDQQRALALTEGLATRKIQRELASLQGIDPEQRRQGKADLTVRYDLKETRVEGEQYYFFFALKVELPQGQPIEKRVLISTAQFDGAWRVTNYDEFDVAK